MRERSWWYRPWHHKKESLLSSTFEASKMARWIQALSLLATAASASAFVGPSSIAQPARLPSTKLFGNTKQPPALPPVEGISYGEESRKYRRTVYTHDDWVRHRSPDRFTRNLQNFVSSGVYKNIGNEVAAVTSVAILVVVWNALVGGYQDFSGIAHPGLLEGDNLPMLGLPMAPFTLSSPSLGLLLVFRTNTSYQRWDEARKNWGMNINHTRDLVRMANAYYDKSATTPARREKDLAIVATCTWAFVRSMKRHLSPVAEDEEDFKRELRERLPPKQAQAIIDAAHRPNRALFDLSLAVENLPMHFIRRNEIHKAMTIFEDNLGSSERLLSSPVPLFYSRHTARFLSVWLLLLPLAIYEPLSGATWNSVGLIPATGLISVFLFGIEELATQMEEPFTILPMQAFCDKIGNWCNEIVGWVPGDNDMFVAEPRPEDMRLNMASDKSTPVHVVLASDRSDAVASLNGHGSIVEPKGKRERIREKLATFYGGFN